MNPTIAFVDVLGLCYDGYTLNRRGLGGSESAIILMSRELAKLGFTVHVYNDCTSDDCSPGIYDGVEYFPLQSISTLDATYDIFISSRTVAPFVKDPARFKCFGEMPNFEKMVTKAKHRILWMHDTFCDGDEFIEQLIKEGGIHRVFTLSDFHTSYVTNCDHGQKRMFEVMKDKVFQTRNGINRWIDWVDITQKDPDLFVYNASVTKGMIPLVEKIWPKIKQHCPAAKLTVIGGFYKFRDDHGPDEQEKKWHELKELEGQLDLTFTGVIKQDEIAELMAKASYMIYPAAFPETYGISTLESMAYNTPLLTCRFGALEETAVDLASYKIDYPIEPNGLFPHINEYDQLNRFIDMCINAYRDRYLHDQKMNACNQIRGIETWDTVALQWKQYFFKELGLFLPVEEYREVTKINERVHEVFGRRFMNPVERTIRKQKERRIMVITPVFNSEKWITKCIESVAQQDYDNYEMHIINDMSTDYTFEYAQAAIQNLPDEIRGKFYLQRNRRNFGAVRNQVERIRDYCGGDDIIMLLDGDDWLVNDPTIFDKYNNLYHEGYQFTYGSCWSVIDNIPLISQEYPPEVKKYRSYREYKFAWNMPYTHLRTFHSSLFEGTADDNFQDNDGNWYKAGGDGAIFYTLIERVDPDKIKVVTDIMYNYNDKNPFCDYKVNSEEQTRNANEILGKK
jgi:glycosyltransferase involved in cell wall biosynthesis